MEIFGFKIGGGSKEFDANGNKVAPEQAADQSRAQVQFVEQNGLKEVVKAEGSIEDPQAYLDEVKNQISPQPEAANTFTPQSNIEFKNNNGVNEVVKAEGPIEDVEAYVADAKQGLAGASPVKHAEPQASSLDNGAIEAEFKVIDSSTIPAAESVPVEGASIDAVETASQVSTPDMQVIPSTELPVETPVATSPVENNVSDNPEQADSSALPEAA